MTCTGLPFQGKALSRKTNQNKQKQNNVANKNIHEQQYFWHSVVVFLNIIFIPVKSSKIFERTNTQMVP